MSEAHDDGNKLSVYFTVAVSGVNLKIY